MIEIFYFIVILLRSLHIQCTSRAVLPGFRFPVSICFDPDYFFLFFFSDHGRCGTNSYSMYSISCPPPPFLSFFLSLALYALFYLFANTLHFHFPNLAHTRPYRHITCNPCLPNTLHIAASLYFSFPSHPPHFFFLCHAFGLHSPFKIHMHLFGHVDGTSKHLPCASFPRSLFTFAHTHMRTHISFPFHSLHNYLVAHLPLLIRLQCRRKSSAVCPCASLSHAVHRNPDENLIPEPIYLAYPILASNPGIPRL